MILILGAGLTGLSTAYHLKDKDYLIVEREAQVGGLCRSMRCGGFAFDYTGHLLHFKYSHVKEFVDEVLQGSIAPHVRDSRVYSHNRYINYPFQANLNGLPEAVARECMVGYIKAWAQREFPKVQRKAHCAEGKTGPPDFQQWVIEQFGPGIARHFFIPYNEKLWLRPLDELSSSWASSMIPVVGLKETLLGYFGKGRNGYGYNSLFYYPVADGIDLLPRAFLRKVRNIKTKAEAVKIFPQRKQVRLNDGSVLNYDALVSTAPLPELIGMVEGLPEKIAVLASRLQYVSVHNINIGLIGRGMVPWHWAYFPEENLPFYRIGLFSNFSKEMAPDGSTSIYVEISRKAPGEGVPLSDKSLMEYLIRCGIARSGDDIRARVDAQIKYAYVIFDNVREEALSIIKSHLDKYDIHSVGRYGAWGYHSMEDCLLEGKKTAELLSIIEP